MVIALSPESESLPFKRNAVPSGGSGQALTAAATDTPREPSFVWFPEVTGSFRR